MKNYFHAAQNHEITYVEAYIQTQNAMLQQATVLNPTIDDFKHFELLQKQLRQISYAITEECIEREGYGRNPDTYLWEHTP